MVILDLADITPPFLCRLMARRNKGWHPMSCADIAAASGLSKSYVAKISKLKSWGNITCDVADRFSRACGVDLTIPKETHKWIYESKMGHVKRGTARQRKLFAELLKAGLKV